MPVRTGFWLRAAPWALAVSLAAGCGGLTEEEIDKMLLAEEMAKRKQSIPARPAANPWRPKAPERAWKMIVIHHTAFEEAAMASVDELHRAKRGWDEMGYHFIIGNGTESGDGQTEVGSRWVKQKHGAHTRAEPGFPYAGTNWVNENGIGICLVGNLQEHGPSPAQITSLRRLVRWLQKRYGIPNSQVKKHRDFKVTDCPGRSFPWVSFILSLPGPQKEGGRRTRGPGGLSITDGAPPSWPEPFRRPSDL